MQTSMKSTDPVDIDGTVAESIDSAINTSAFGIDCSDWNTRISAQWDTAYSQIDNPNDKFYDVAALSSDGLPFKLRQSLHEFKQCGNSRGVLLFRNLQLHECDNTTDEFKDYQASRLIAM